MNKYLVTLNNEKFTFGNFKDASFFFIKEISEYFWKHMSDNKDTKEITVFNSACLPDSLASFICYLYDERIITDEEILLETRLGMLLSHLACNDPVEIKENALKSINKSYDYFYENEEIGYSVEIRVDYSPDEIVVELNLEDDDSYLCTNAFIVDDDTRKYYLSSHQVCHTSSKRGDLGVATDLNITLEKCNES